MRTISEPSRLRLAAVGCGRVFERFYLPALERSPDWSLVGAVDDSADRLRWLSQRSPELPVAVSLAELADSVTVDAVLISTPPRTHCALAAEALRRGAHALIEKPMAVSPREAESLVRLARELGRRTFVGFNRRFRPSYAAVRERVRGLSSRRIRGITFELRTDPSAWGAMTNHRTDEGSGDAVLDDLASHQLDLVPWIVDRPVEEVRTRFESSGDATTAAIELRFRDGVVAHCRAAHAPGAAEWLELQLDDRTVTANAGGVTSTAAGLARPYLAARTNAAAVIRRLTGAPALTAETFERQIAAWAAALRGQGQPSDGCADGSAGERCVNLVDACRRSAAADGAWVGVSRT